MEKRVHYRIPVRHSGASPRHTVPSGAVGTAAGKAAGWQSFPSGLWGELVDGGGHHLPIHAVVDNRFELSVAQPRVF